VDQMKNLGLKDWMTAKLDWQKIEESRELGRKDFLNRCKKWSEELDKLIPKGARVVMAHTMAGGVPRAKVIMPAMNRVFKGHGVRFASSEEFWSTDLGKLCDQNFEEVTADTLSYLIEVTTPLRARLQNEGGQISYVAYGYHGTEILVEGKYHWQSYSPYLQGFAKLKLENIAKENWQKDVKISVFNAPEILTNSSSIFLGVEVPLYTLMAALKKENAEHSITKEVLADCKEKLKEGTSLEDLMKMTDTYFTSAVIQQWTKFEEWPQHNGPEQMSQMRQISDEIIALHKTNKDLMTSTLSEAVFKACGRIMLSEAAQPKTPVLWIGHDAVARALLR
ncbi:MAG: hypothetical protein KDD22_01240, partial [Bdellovibrionales bacterium]|nr:hypothetical protein [Bdellovibrionales bacterium]